MKGVSLLRTALAAVVAAGLLGGTAALTRVPVELHAEDEALLRLSWRLDRAAIRECRPATAAERARMPAHMARDEICEERAVPYELRVELDDRELVRRTLEPRGLRGDRPLSVFLEEPLPPGEARIAVTFRPLLPPAGDEGAREVADGDDPPSLEFQGAVALGAREVALVTLDRDAGRLVLRTASDR